MAAAVAGFSTWHVLRVHQGLSGRAAQTAVAEALVVLLKDAARPLGADGAAAPMCAAPSREKRKRGFSSST